MSPRGQTVDSLVRELGSLVTLDVEVARVPGVEVHFRVQSARDALRTATIAVAEVAGSPSQEDPAVLAVACDALVAAREAVEHARAVVQQALAADQS